MRKITISLFAVFTCGTAFAAARLPIVDVSAGSVSARVAFGEKPVVSEIPETKAVVARATKNDSNKKIAVKSAPKSKDILSPKKPSDDLWARVQKPLRLPEPDEFSVIKTDYDLPEESIDRQSVVARASVPVIKDPDMDAQIAKLVELQKKSEESLKPTIATRPSTISSYDLKSVAQNTRPIREEYTLPDNDDIAKVRESVSIKRVVVPMENDVIVRSVTPENKPVDTFTSESDLAKMSPGELKKAFKKTYMSENKHLSTYQIDNRFDVASDTSANIEGFVSERDLSESGGVRPLEIRVGFRGDDSALSRDTYNLLSEYASLVVSNPKRAIQVSIPERFTRTTDGRKLAARRLAIVEQVLRDTGVSDQRIMPVLSQRTDESFVLRVISSDQYETMTQQKRDMFGDSVGKKTYKSMTW